MKTLNICIKIPQKILSIEIVISDGQQNKGKQMNLRWTDFTKLLNSTRKRKIKKYSFSKCQFLIYHLVNKLENKLLADKHIIISLETLISRKSRQTHCKSEKLELIFLLATNSIKYLTKYKLICYWHLQKVV